MRWSVSIVLFLICVCAVAQEAAFKYYVSEGVDRESAGRALMEQLFNAVRFHHSQQLLTTYTTEILRMASEEDYDGKVALSLSSKDVSGVFMSRSKKAMEIVAQGDRSSNDGLKKLYYTWGWYYLTSLPTEYETLEADRLRSWLKEHVETQVASLPVPMTHIEREVAAIRQIVGDPFAESPVKVAVKSSMNVPAPKDEIHQQSIERQVLDLPLPTNGPSSLALTNSRGNIISCLPLMSNRLPAENKLDSHLLLTVGLAPEPVIGIMAGFHFKWGAIASVQSDWHMTKAEVDALSDGTIPGVGFFWPNGESRVSNLLCLVGPSYELCSWASAWVGTGYGYRMQYWKDMSGMWVRISDKSAQGVSLGAGAVFYFKHLSAAASISSVELKTLGFSIGLGVSF